MPLLISPIDGQPMKQIQRYGIEIDVCPSTGGVWLDKGELEKLLAIVREAVEDEEREEQRYEQRRAAQPAQQPIQQPMAQPAHYQQMPPQQQYQQPHYGKSYKYDDDDDYYKHKGHKKSKLKSILDIFD